MSVGSHITYVDIIVNESSGGPLFLHRLTTSLHRPLLFPSTHCFLHQITYRESMFLHKRNGTVVRPPARRPPRAPRAPRPPRPPNDFRKLRGRSERCLRASEDFVYWIFCPATSDERRGRRSRGITVSVSQPKTELVVERTNESNELSKQTETLQVRKCRNSRSRPA
ncbi:hypothetical protein EVAR_93199_1 [Eumeta japonica]|uniref:Uncharacterized protein n=1 Tax=Eumeta variegata TaxID=151549 RepID=A0A4C1TXI6_EUMVA|nr:hypothetical protein EVAR_93199_1 [Eumeta japonica]